MTYRGDAIAFIVAQGTATISLIWGLMNPQFEWNFPLYIGIAFTLINCPFILHSYSKYRKGIPNNEKDEYDFTC